MKKSMLYLAVGVLGLAACADEVTQPGAVSGPQAAVMSAAVAQAEDAGYVVRFEAGTPASFEADVAALGGSIEFISEQGGFANVKGLTPEGVAALSTSTGVSAMFEDVPVSLNAEGEIGMMESMPLDVTPMSVTNPAGAFRHNYQWNMRAINAPAAWAAGELGSSDVTVAILDTGIDYDNFDMNGIVDVARSRSFIARDDSLNTLFFPTRNKVDDLNGHGTNVATQVSSGGVLFAGVNSRVRLMGVKVLGFNGSGTLGGILAGLMYAADAGADVANMSLGVRNGVNKALSPGFMDLTNEAFNYANAQGMIVVVSAGNDSTNMNNKGRTFAAYCEATHVICVSALGPTASTNAFTGPWTNQDAGASYSNTGRSIAVSAPGGTSKGWVASQCARHLLQQLSATQFSAPCNTAPGFFIAIGFAGTSQASPHVAGVVAAMVGKYGKNNPAQIRHRLVKSVDDLGKRGDDDVYGAGRINLAKALGLQ
ncbi:MAG TPA: S8 family serine peptidase [Longimicrobiales bacterium]